MKIVWCNGEWIEASVFAVSPFDRGLLHGFGLFETILAANGSVVFGDLHLDRLAAGARRLGWQLETDGLLEVVPSLLERNGLRDGRVRLAVTAGEGPFDQPHRGAHGRVWMSASPVAALPSPLLVTVSSWRRNERSPLAGLKCASYAENLVALQQARSRGFDEVVWLNTQGFLCEGAMANLFFVAGGTLCTPSLDCGCLPGVTRALVIELAGRAGVPCREGSFMLADLTTADEVFLTSSTQGVRPVVGIDGRLLAAGPITERLRQQWRRLAGLA